MEIRGYDIIIVGHGPAGLTAALYASRNNFQVLVIGQQPGGAMGLASVIENYPGIESISGYQLTEKMQQQVTKFGGELVMDIVTDIRKLPDGNFEVHTENEETYNCKAVILATGGKHRKLGVPHEEEMSGKGLSYCATCDGPFYKNKIVTIIGSGDAAATAILLVANLAKKIHWIIRKPNWSDIKCEPVYLERIKALSNVEIFRGRQITELLIDEKKDMVIGAKFSDESTILSDGLFIEIGSDPQTELALKLGCTIENGLIVVNDHQQTNVAGVFAAGDVTSKIRNPRYRQISTSVGAGTIAALAAVDFIKNKN